MEEGGAEGKAGAGAGSRLDDGPNKDMVLCIWEVGAA